MRKRKRRQLSKKRIKRIKSEAEKAWEEAHSLYVPNERRSDGRDGTRGKRMGDLG
jgi:hypothetical protein